MLYFLGACVLAVLAFGLLLLTRKARERRSQPHVEIPEFLRKPGENIHDPARFGETQIPPTITLANRKD